MFFMMSTRCGVKVEKWRLVLMEVRENGFVECAFCFR